MSLIPCTTTSTSTKLPVPTQIRTRLATLQHRVLIYVTCYNVLDGVTLTIRKLEQEILAAGHHVCILTTQSGDMNHTHLHGIHPNRHVIFMDNAIPIPFLHDIEKPELTYSIGFALSSKVKQQIEYYEPSIIHLCAIDSTSLHIIQYARLKEIPIMGTFHSNIPEYMEHYSGLSWLRQILGAFFRHQYNYLQALYVPTPYIQQHLIDEYAMDLVTSIHIWGRGVDIDKFHPKHRSISYRQSIGVMDESIPIILWVGRLVPEKRIDIFMTIIQRLYEQQYKFHAVVVGAGSAHEDDIRNLPNTSFVGWKTIDELSIIYASCDILLFPSAVETFGNVTLEALASGLPVIVEAACSGHLVHVDMNGYTCPAGDVNAFYDATVALVDDKQLRDDFGTYGREMALSLEKSMVVRQMMDNYSYITDEFYTEYSGRHTNRDMAYTHTGSFLLGKYPRPFILIIFESIFIFLFNLIWKLTNCLVWFQTIRTTGPTTGGIVVVPTTTATKPTTAKKSLPIMTDITSIPSSSIHSHTPKEKQTMLVSFSGSNNSSSSNNKNKRRTHPTTNHVESVIEMNDVEIGHKNSSSSSSNNNNHHHNIREPLLSNDDHTSATSCNSSHNSLTTGNTTTISTSTSSSSYTKSLFSDKRISHIIAKLFVLLVQYQCRCESFVRQSISSLCTYCMKRHSSTGSTHFHGAAKRKNSSMNGHVLSTFYDLGDTSHDTCIRCGSELYDSDIGTGCSTCCYNDTAIIATTVPTATSCNTITSPLMMDETLYSNCSGGISPSHSKNPTIITPSNTSGGGNNSSSTIGLQDIRIMMRRNQVS